MKIVITTHTGYAGMDSHDFYEINDDFNVDDLDDFAYQCAKDNAESYGIYAKDEYENAEDSDDLDDNDSYSDNIEGFYEVYDPEKHDNYRCGGDKSWHKLTI